MDRIFSDRPLLRQIGDRLQSRAFTPYALGYIAAKETESRYLVHKFSNEINRPTITDLKFQSLKSSDTLYILGTGSSVNRYSKQEWEKISAGDSVGMNYWGIHDFVPDVYSFELPRNLDKRNSLYELFQLKSEDYIDTTFLLKNIPTLSYNLDIDRIPQSIVDNLYLSREIPIPWDEDENKSFGKGCRILNKLGYFSQKTITRVPYRSGSLIYLISLGINMGYKQIVLCGVDLSNPEHFFTEKSEFYLQQGIPLPQQSVERNVHKTVSPRKKSITVIDIIEQIQKTILSKRSTELFVGSQESALYPMLGYYFNTD